MELKKLEEQLRIDAKKREIKAAQQLELKYTSLLNQLANERMKLKEDQNQVFMSLTSFEIEK